MEAQQGLRIDPRVSSLPAGTSIPHHLIPSIAFMVPNVGAQGQGWTWAGAGLYHPQVPAHILRDTLPSKILLPGPFHAFPQATLQAPPRAASTAPPKAPPLVFTTRVVQAASCTQAPPMPRP